HPRAPLELLRLAVLRLLPLLLELLRMDFPVGDALLAPGQLGQLPVDLLLLREDALLDLEGLGPPLRDFLLDVGAQLHGLLADLDLRLAAHTPGLPARRCHAGP